MNTSATSASSKPVAIKHAVKHKHSVSDTHIVFMDKDAVALAAAAAAKGKQRASIDFVPDQCITVKVAEKREAGAISELRKWESKVCLRRLASREQARLPDTAQWCYCLLGLTDIC